MELFRIFPWNPKAGEHDPGGPFYVPRHMQGSGRHDLPHLDGVLYCSQSAISAVAEHIQGFRGKTIRAIHLKRPNGSKVGFARFTCNAKNLLNLDDPQTLARLNIKPSMVLTHERQTTRLLAEKLYRTGVAGLLWPSALEASWINASLFLSRVRSSLSLVGSVTPLSLDSPALREAATIIGVNTENN